MRARALWRARWRCTPARPRCRSSIHSLSARKPRVCSKPYSENHAEPPTPAVLVAQVGRHQAEGVPQRAGRPAPARSRTSTGTRRATCAGRGRASPPAPCPRTGSATAGRAAAERAVRAVDVEPEPCAGADVGHRVQRVDGAGVDGAGASPPRRTGRPAARPVAAHRARQRVGSIRNAASTGTVRTLPAAQAQQLGGLADAAVALGTGDVATSAGAVALQPVGTDVDAGAGGGAVPGRRERGQGRHRAAADQQPAARRSGSRPARRASAPRRAPGGRRRGRRRHSSGSSRPRPGSASTPDRGRRRVHPAEEARDDRCPSGGSGPARGSARAGGRRRGPTPAASRRAVPGAHPGVMGGKTAPWPSPPR